ncbi:MAG: hypothetical protein M0Z46_06685 [Actinomycetota bacterium]|jgi:hypothetical protein|nr:hypothetical protein [Actinomycetota bacterium]
MADEQRPLARRAWRAMPDLALDRHQFSTSRPQSCTTYQDADLEAVLRVLGRLSFR